VEPFIGFEVRVIPPFTVEVEEIRWHFDREETRSGQYKALDCTVGAETILLGKEATPGMTDNDEGQTGVPLLDEAPHCFNALNHLVMGISGEPSEVPMHFSCHTMADMVGSVNTVSRFCEFGC